MARGFIKEHKFDQHFVMGLHVRAGNGEVGDFTQKGRELDDLVSWIDSFAKMMVDFVSSKQYHAHGPMEDLP